MVHSCRELLPIIETVTSLGDALGLQRDLTTIHVPIHEDNKEALILENSLTSQYTPQSKHYAIRTIWFHEEIVKRGIKLVKIDTVEQLGDMFTKALPTVIF